VERRASPSRSISVGRLRLAKAQSHAYPALLSFPAPSVRLPAQAVIAEKLDALVVLGDRNSRSRFLDLHHLAQRFEFDRLILTESIRRTFERRKTRYRPSHPSV